MRIGFVDNGGFMVSVAWLALNEGNEVRYVIKDGKPEESKIGDGLIPKFKTVKELIDWKPSIVITYNTPEVTPVLEKAGIATWGSDYSTVELEKNRMYAGGLVKRYQAGQVPRMFRFSSAEKALSFIDEDGGRKPWVFKAEGTGASVSTTHVTESDEHLRSIIEFESNRGAKGFVLQEFVDGIEISIEGWYDYRIGWLYPINSTLERKHMFAGDKGPMTGCMGSVVWPWPQDRPKLFRQTLEKFTPYLKDIEYVGPFDGNYIIDYKTRQPNFLEFTPRFGWDAFEAMSMLGFGWGQFFDAIAHGQASRVPVSFGSYGAAVRIYAPTAPDVPVFAPLTNPQIYPKDVWNDDGLLRTTGSETTHGFSVVFEACTAGSTVKKATSQIYEEVIPEICVTDMAYRDDIGEKAEKDIEILEAWGYTVKAPPRKEGRLVAVGIEIHAEGPPQLQ